MEDRKEHNLIHKEDSLHQIKGKIKKISHIYS